MTEFRNGGQRVNDLHIDRAATGEAIATQAPIIAVPLPKVSRKRKGRAIDPVKPIFNLPAPQDRDGHVAPDTQVADAVARGSGHMDTDTHRRDAGPATRSRRRGHRSGDDHGGCAPAGDGAARIAQTPKVSVPPVAKPKRRRHADLDAQQSLASAGESGARMRLSPNRGVPRLAKSTAYDPRVSASPLSQRIDTIRDVMVQRRTLHKAEKSLGLTIGARARAMAWRRERDEGKPIKRDKNGRLKFPKPTKDDVAQARAVYAPIVAAIEIINQARLDAEKRAVELVNTLPVASFCDDIKGFGPLGLAVIIGEAGDIGRYRGPAALWKRMGVAAINGRAQRKVKGEGALEQEYSPTRHAATWTIGYSIVCAQVRNLKDDEGHKTGEMKALGPYGELYLERRAYELERNPEMTTGYAHKRAKRYVEKRLLRELWRAWRAATWVMKPNGSLPPAEVPLAAE